MADPVGNLRSEGTLRVAYLAETFLVTFGVFQK